MTIPKDIKKIIDREISARENAEKKLEEKSLELLNKTQQLEELNTSLEKEVSKRTEKIKRREEQLRVLFDQHPSASIVYDLDSLKILAANQTALDIYGYTQKEFRDMSILDMNHEKEHKRIKNHIELLSKQKTEPQKWCHILKNGELRTVTVTGNPIVFGDKKARLVIIKDITHEQEILQRLEDQEKQFKNLVERTSDAIYRTDEDGNFIYANPNCESLFECTIAELSNMNIYDLVSKEYKERVRNFYAYQAQNKISNTKTEFPITKTNGENIWIEQTVDFIPADEGSSEFISVTRDITEKRILEKSLLRSEEKYRSIIENMELGILEVDTKGKILKAYPKFCKLTGYEEKELIGKIASEIFLDEVTKDKMHKETQKRTTGETSVYEIELKKKDGSKIWVMISAAPYYNEKNRITGSVGVHLDITRRKTSEKQLALLSQFPELNPYPVIRYKLGKNELLYANKHAKSFLKSMQRETQKKNNWAKFVYSKGVFQEFRWNNSTYRFNRVEEPELGIINIYSTDITEIKELQNKLRGAIKKAENLSKAKDLFLANMSHEIRTPMNAIIGLSEVLSESELSDFQRTSLDRIRSASDNLLHLINEILDLSKVESNEIELNNSFHYLEKTFKNSKELFEIEADKKNIKLIYDSNIDPELEFFTDKNRLNQVLINLLGNAIKFTDTGQVTLKIEQEEELKESLTVNISVIDTGIGIPKKDLKTIFENFSQARNNDENTYGGTGLGLSIAKKILLLMNSELKVNSKLGEGSTFYFTLKMPYRRNSSSVELNTIEQNIIKIENCKILVAEDNLTNQFLIKTILEKHGISTTVASNGIEALKILEKENFDIILMDMRMPQLDGLETTKVIRKEFKNSTTPIIALTANASENDRKLCLEAGMNEFIVKPFKPNDLIAMIEKINEENNKSSFLDIEKLNESTYNDPVFREKMIEIFINDSEKRCLEIENLIKNNELDKISVIAHSMKPALGHLAHEKLVLMANEIENEQDLSKKGFVELCQELISYTRDLIEELKNIPKMEKPQPNREE